MSLSNEYKKLVSEKSTIDECVAIAYDTILTLSKLLEKFDILFEEYNINFNFNGTILCFIKPLSEKAKIRVNNKNFSGSGVTYMLDAFTKGTDFDNVSLDDMLHIFGNLNHIFVTVTNEIGAALNRKVVEHAEKIPNFIVKGLV